MGCRFRQGIFGIATVLSGLAIHPNVIFAQATLLVDTGAAATVINENTLGLDASNSTLNCTPLPSCRTIFQFVATQFTLTSGTTLDSVQGWMQGSLSTTGNITVRIYTDNNGALGSSIFSKNYPSAAIPATFNWATFANFNPVLDAGTYWVAFEPVPDGKFDALMTRGAPNPLPSYAVKNTAAAYHSIPGFSLGIRIYGVGSTTSAAFGTFGRVTQARHFNGNVDVIKGDIGQARTPVFSEDTDGGIEVSNATITNNGLSAGAWSSSSFSGGAARGLAFRTFLNNTNASLQLKVNAVLSGKFESNSVPHLTNNLQVGAAIRIFDATAFNTRLSASTVSPGQFLLGDYSFVFSTDPPTVFADLDSLFSGALLTKGAVFQSPGTYDQHVTFPISTGLTTIAPQAMFTVMFDVTASSTGGSGNGADFSDTLEPAQNLFTDINGNPITTGIQTVGSSVTPPDPPASIVLTPANATNPAGTPQTVSATVKTVSGALVTNTLVKFTDLSGPNAGVPGVGQTDSNGLVSFTYTDDGGAGTDAIQASIGAITSNTIQLSWQAPGPLDHITVSPGVATVSAGVSQAYTATAFDRFNNSRGDVTSQTVFSITPDGSCLVAACKATVPGTHSVTATYSGVTAQGSLMVDKTMPLISWPTPAPITAGTPLGSSQLNASANVSGLFVYTPPIGTILNAGPRTLSVVFTPTDTANYRSANAQVTLTVNAAAPGSTTIVFLRTDKSTGGNWKGIYGADGSLIPNDSVQTPSYATVTLGSALAYTWQNSTADPRALLKYNSATDHVASTYYNSPGFTIDANFTDGQPHQLALYLIDWDSNNRSETIEILDAANNNVLDTRSLASFVNLGQYLVWQIQGRFAACYTTKRP